MSHDQIVSLLNGKIRDRDAEIERLKNENAFLNLELSKHTITVADVGHRNQHLRAALAVCVVALGLVRKIPRPGIDGGVTHAEWEGAWVKIDAAQNAAQAALTKDV